MRKETDLVYCPIKDVIIESFDCMIISDIVDGMFSEKALEERYGIIIDEKLRDICIRCRWHDDGRIC